MSYSFKKKTDRNNKIIFIIDDEVQYLNILSETLQKNNKNLIIYTYSNGYKAMEDLEKVKPDLIILDQDMPIISGLELCKQFSLCLKDKNILISTSNINAIDSFKQIGMSNFLTKPFALTELITIINNI